MIIERHVQAFKSIRGLYSPSDKRLRLDWVSTLTGQKIAD